MPRPTPDRFRRRERPLARAGVAAAASLLLNLAAGGALAVAGALRLPQQKPAPIALTELSPDAWAANRAISAAPVAPAPAPPEAASPAPSALPRPIPPGHIVSVAPSPDARRPANARFLAERDNTVSRDVQYRGPIPDGPAPVAARPTAGAAGAQGVPLPGEDGAAEEAAPGREGSPGTGEDAAARVARARLALADDGERAAPVLAGLEGAAGDRRPGEGGARRAGRFDPRILPVGDRFEGVGGGRPMADRLAGVAEGDETLLNTRAFRYADFYRRVGEAIRSEWDPNRAWDALDPHDRALGREARRVVVDIVLDRGGRLVEVTVAGSSGLAFFDREALRAIAAAAPFPNPPAGLVGGDGRIVLAQFGLRFEWPEHALLDRLVGAKRP